MTIRLHVDAPLAEGADLALPEAAARHAQVRRVQPGDTLRLFDGRGREHEACVVSMGRREVVVRVGPPAAALPEPACAVTLAVGMPANERMDALVEKATELGVAAIQPLHCARGVLRLQGERALRRREHWQAVAANAAEQCGRAVVPALATVQDCAAWCAALPPAATVQARVLLSLSPQALSPQGWRAQFLSPAAAAVPGAAAQASSPASLLVLSGPEGGLAPLEEDAAVAAGFVRVGLGPRVLRADTAPLALLAWWMAETGSGAHMDNPKMVSPDSNPC